MASDNEEDDYMSMAITEPSRPKEKETYTQRRVRKAREAEINGRTKSKKELAAEVAAARDAALSTTLPTDSKGFQMMAKLGFKQGSTLGASSNNPHARAEPLSLVVKEDRGGIGLDSEKKRKFREEVEGEAKRAKTEEGEYRERVAREREERRLEGLLGGAMRVAERIDGEEEGMGSKEGNDGVAGVNSLSANVTKRSKPTRQVNVLWRGLVRQREEDERERRRRYDLCQSLSRNANHDDLEEDKQDRQAWGDEEEELEEEVDLELDELNALDFAERLEKLVRYLRETYHYCFWCKFRYSDANMEGCPGVLEEDHD